MSDSNSDTELPSEARETCVLQTHENKRCFYAQIDVATGNTSINWMNIVNKTLGSATQSENTTVHQFDQIDHRRSIELLIGAIHKPTVARHAVRLMNVCREIINIVADSAATEPALPMVLEQSSTTQAPTREAKSLAALKWVEHKFSNKRRSKSKTPDGNVQHDSDPLPTQTDAAVVLANISPATGDPEPSLSVRSENELIIKPTEPSVLDQCRATPKSTSRVIRRSKQNKTQFHPYEWTFGTTKPPAPVGVTARDIRRETMKGFMNSFRVCPTKIPTTLPGNVGSRGNFSSFCSSGIVS